MFLFALPFAGFGLFAMWDGVKKIFNGDRSQGIGICLFGLVFACVGFGLMFAAVMATPGWDNGDGCPPPWGWWPLCPDGIVVIQLRVAACT